MLIFSLYILEPRNTLLKAGNNLFVELFSTEACNLLRYSLYQVKLVMVISFGHFSLCTFFFFSARVFRIPTKPAITGKRSEQNKKYSIEVLDFVRSPTKIKWF